MADDAGSGSQPPAFQQPVVVTEGDDPQDWGWLPRRTSTFTRVLIILASLGVVLLIASLWLKSWIDDRLDPPGDEGAELVVNIPQGASTNDIARILQDEGVVANSTVFRYYLRYKDSGEFQAGNYVLNENMSVWRAKDVLLAGPAPGPALDAIRVVLPEGLTLVQIRAQLLEQLPTFNDNDLARALAFPPLRSDFQPANSTLEGMLFPDTYLLDSATAEDEAALVIRLINQFDAVASDVGLETAPDTVGVTPYEAVIVASLIEKEALIAEDRAKIARVIYNRLGNGWPLQIDAAVRYAVSKPTEPLTLADLAVDNPYNVYNRTGLPPGPIAAPGRESLVAALNPADGFWMFYARTDDPVTGAHTFSNTGEEHEAAVAICRERNLGC